MDGVFSAALVSIAEGVNEVIFCGANEGADEHDVNEDDIIVDLRPSNEVGLWFDHHRSNLNSKGKFKGSFELKKSCSEVVYDYYKDKIDFPEFMINEIKGVSKADTFGFDEEDFKKNVPALKIMRSTMVDESEEEKSKFLNRLFIDLKKYNFEKLSDLEYVKKRILKNIKENKQILEDADNGKLHKGLIVFVTKLKTGYIDLYPKRKESFEAVLMLKDVGERYNVFMGRNTFHKNTKIVEERCDFGKIMVPFGGGGHRGAAGCLLEKDKKDEFVKHVVKNWLEQRYG